MLSFGSPCTFRRRRAARARAFGLSSSHSLVLLELHRALRKRSGLPALTSLPSRSPILSRRAIILDVRRDEVLSTFTDAAGAGAGADALLGGSRAAAGARARAAAARAVRALAFGQGAGAAGGAGSDAAAAAASGAAGRRAPLLAAGGDAGSIVLWDLEQGRLAGVAPRAHAGRVTSLHWFAGEPRIASSGADNALRQWAADSPGASPRPLRERAGHAAPPLRCLFHGDEGEASAVLALCAEADPATVRIHSTRKEDRGRAFGEGARAGLGAARARRLGVEAAELLPSRGVAIASAALRSREWDDCVTAHEGEAAALTWSTDRGARGDHLLGGARAGATTGAGGGYLSADASTTLAPATCVAVTRDGNFAYVGRANGAVDRWNVQSGVARGGLVRKQADPADGVALAHDGRVVAVFHAPAAGRVLTAGADGVARVWGARSLALEGEVALGSPAAAAHVDLAGRLAAVACDDLAIRVLDLEVRKTEGKGGGREGSGRRKGGAGRRRLRGGEARAGDGNWSGVLGPPCGRPPSRKHVSSSFPPLFPRFVSVARLAEDETETRFTSELRAKRPVASLTIAISLAVVLRLSRDPKERAGKFCPNLPPCPPPPLIAFASPLISAALPPPLTTPFSSLSPPHPSSFCRLSGSCAASRGTRTG